MVILITGGSGIIGKKLAAKLKADNIEVKVMSRQATNDNPSIITADLSDPASLELATKGIDTVIHLAGLTHARHAKAYLQVNTLGTKNLLAACQKNQVRRFIFISSRTASVAGGAYAQSKLQAEELVKQSGLDWLIVRPAEIYGAGPKEAIAQIIHRLQRGQRLPIIGSGQYLTAPVHVDDAVAAMAAAALGAATKQTYTIAGPEEISYQALVDRLAAILNQPARKIYLPVWLAKLVAMTANLLGQDFIVKDQIPRLMIKKSADISQAKQDLGFNPVNLETGVKKLLSTAA